MKTSKIHTFGGNVMLSLVIGLAVSLAASSLHAQQTAAPIADVSAGDFSPTPIYTSLNEASSDGTGSEILEDATDATSIELQMDSNLFDPEQHTGHTIGFDMIKAGRGTATFTVTLLQGATTIATSGSYTVPTVYGPVSWTLSEAQAANITDYTDLRIRFDFDSNTVLMKVSWVQLSIPALETYVSNGSGASSITAGGATLNGNLGPTGGDDAHVYIYWGDEDGGTAPGGWDTTIDKNTLSVGTFNQAISGLTANKTYYYRCFANNAGGDKWAASTSQFTTEPPTIAFSQGTSSGLESAGQATITVTLSDVSAQSAAATLSVSGGTAANGSDYTLSAPQSIVLPAGATSTNIIVPINNDDLDENLESFILTLSSPVGASMGLSAHTHSILDNNPAPNVSFVSPPFGVSENAGNATIYVALSAESGKEVKINYGTSNLDAIQGMDYTNTSGTLTWTIGQTGSKSFTVPIINDTDQEGNQKFRLTLSGESNCGISGDNPTDVTIYDDDLGPPILDNHTGASGVQSAQATLYGLMTGTGGAPTTVTVYWDTSDKGTNFTWSYNAALGQRSTGTFSTVAGSLSANTPYFYRCYAQNSYGGAWAPATTNFLTGPPKVQFDLVSSSALENNGTAIFQVSISEPAIYGLPVTVNYSATGGDAESPADYSVVGSSLTIPAGQTSTSLAVTVVNEGTYEGDETVVLTLDTPGNATLGPNSVHTFTIQNDDQPPLVSYDSTPYLVGEDEGTVAIRVALNEASTVTTKVSYATSDGTASSPGDYTSRSGVFTWNPGDTATKQFTVPIVDDSLQEGILRFNITLSSFVNCDVDGSAISVVTINEDDVDVPDITNGGGASNVEWTTATINGFVDQVFPVPTNYMFWGSTDGGQSTSAWEHAIYKGSDPGAFSEELEGLEPGRTYHYRCYAESWAGQTWAAATAQFTMKATTAVPGNDYYVNDNSTNGDLYCSAIGNSGNTGQTAGSPRDDVQSILSSYDLGPGDCIWIDTGYYSISTPIEITSADLGSAANHMVLRGSTAPAGSVIDRGGSLSDDVIFIDEDGPVYVRIESLGISGGYSGIYITGSSGNEAEGIEVVDCDVFENTLNGNGISLRYCDSPLVEGNRCYSNGYYGIYTYRNVTPVIRDNECFEQIRPTGSGLFIIEGSSAVVSDNVSRDNGIYGIGITSPDSTIIGNECYGNSNSGIRVVAPRCTISSNTLYNNAFDGLSINDVRATASDNVMFRNGLSGIYCQKTGAQHHYINNLMYENGDYCIWVENNDNRMIIENNTLWGAAGIYFEDPQYITNINNILCATAEGYAALFLGSSSPQVFVSDHNDIYTTTQTAWEVVYESVGFSNLTEWAAASGQDSNSISADPSFVDPTGNIDGDYHLQSKSGSYHDGKWWADPLNSPCIDSGDMWANFDNEPDYNGLTLNQGAYGNTPEASKTDYGGQFYSVSYNANPAAAGTVEMWPTRAGSMYPTNRLMRIIATETNTNYGWTNWSFGLTGYETQKLFYVDGGKFIVGNFVALQWIIDATAEAGGSISPQGSVAVTASDDQEFIITPDAGNSVLNVWVDGSPQGTITNYTFPSVGADHTIHVDFIIPEWTITATAHTGGALTPDGAVVVVQGNDQPFSIEATGGYVISNVFVDGSPEGAITDYTFLSVTNDHTIEAWFTQVSSVTSNGTPFIWLDTYGYTDYENDDMLDQDNDGMLTWQEYVAGTLPNNDSSVLSVVHLKPQPNTRLRIQFPSVSGKTYRLQRAASVLDNDWANSTYSTTVGGGLDSSPISGTGASITIYVAPSASSHCYRVTVQ